LEKKNLTNSNSSRQVLSTEIEAAKKGKQWPLSCFGPFKEKRSIPNFVDDMQFEEVRLQYLEAKNQNNLQNYTIQLTQSSV
jgi:nucleoporin-like protein 2